MCESIRPAIVIECRPDDHTPERTRIVPREDGRYDRIEEYRVERANEAVWRERGHEIVDDVTVTLS